MADLISLAEYKAFASINSTNQDAEINIVLPKVSQFIKTYCNRTFIDYYATNKIEYSDGNVEYIYLRENPTVEIVSVEYSSDYGRTYTPLVEYEDYALNTTYDRIEAIASTGFAKALNGYKITYKGGYATTPEEVKLACLDLLQYHLKSDMAIKSTRNAGSNTTSVEYVTTANLPAHIRRVLDLYRLDLI